MELKASRVLERWESHSQAASLPLPRAVSTSSLKGLSEARALPSQDREPPAQMPETSRIRQLEDMPQTRMLLRAFATPNVNGFLPILLSPKDGILKNSFIQNFSSRQILKTTLSSAFPSSLDSKVKDRTTFDVVTGSVGGGYKLTWSRKSGACCVSRWCRASLPASQPLPTATFEGSCRADSFTGI